MFNDGTQDLTARARIRDAALLRFPVEGFNATTVRAIAEDAGVSPGLVLHHFGSKTGLRHACDRYVVSTFREQKRAAVAEGKHSDPTFLGAAYRLAPPIMRYLAWALTEGSEPAIDLYDEMFEEASRVMEIAEAAGIVKPSPDPRSRTAVLLSMQLGGLVLHDHLSRTLRVDVLSPNGITALTRASLEIFTNGIFTTEAGELTRAAFEEAVPNIIREESKDG